MRTRVKICGVTRAEDAVAAADCGADALGLVFHPASPRAVTPEAAAEIARAVPPFVTVTALFMDAERADVERVLAALPVDLLQFHGSEAPEWCAAFGRHYIKAVPMGDTADPAGYMARHREAAGFLLDAHRSGAPGGGGSAFDWGRVPDARDRPLILAGGLRPANVAEAVARVRPWAVDVSTGVETAPGIKDKALMGAFIGEVQRGENV